jgi:hypothetical protein
MVCVCLCVCVCVCVCVRERERERERESLDHMMRTFRPQQVEDDQKEIKNACFQYLLGFFKSMDEEGKGAIVGDAFKTAIGKLEEEVSAPNGARWHCSAFIVRTCAYLDQKRLADANGGQRRAMDDAEGVKAHRGCGSRGHD